VARSRSPTWSATTAFDFFAREDEVHYVLAGEGELALDGVARRVGPGTAILTRSGSSHGIRPTGGGDLVQLLAYPVHGR
jgi:mannose-6-phosphate isomerase-like protein (cupin superfamily)